MNARSRERVLTEIDSARDEIVACAVELVKIPTVNPPGDCYRDCATAVGRHLHECGFDVWFLEAEGLEEHTTSHPRVNVLGHRAGRCPRPLIHLNGHIDVVPAGGGWTVGAFDGVVRDGKIYGRGSCDMKAGLAAAIYATEAIRRAGVDLDATLEVSGTVDEESGGFAGVAWMTGRGIIGPERTDFVIIPEPLNVDRICIGHRGVYWFEVTTEGRIAHGSMPFLGVSAIDHMGLVLQEIRGVLGPRLGGRVTAVPVVPEAARRATINVNALEGGQPADGIQTPCVADRSRAIVDRRFLLEEGFDSTRAEIVSMLDGLAARVPGFRYGLRDLMVVQPVRTPDDSPLVPALKRAIGEVLGREASIVASPGTYDHKHVARAGVPHCVAYGPGILELAHQPDEWCGIADLIDATKVLALTILDLAGVGADASR
jgi:succinyl-diaminopimelate desuccinylase